MVGHRSLQRLIIWRNAPSKIDRRWVRHGYWSTAIKSVADRIIRLLVVTLLFRKVLGILCMLLSNDVHCVAGWWWLDTIRENYYAGFSFDTHVGRMGERVGAPR